jgi:hypothetical protein
MMKLGRLIDYIVDMIPRWKQNRENAARARAEVEAFKRGTNAALRRLENEPGWVAWLSCSPPRHELVEVMSGLTGNSFEQVPADMSPMANIYHLYWRPIGSMRYVGDGSSNQIHTPTNQRYMH